MTESIEMIYVGTPLYVKQTSKIKNLNKDRINIEVKTKTNTSFKKTGLITQTDKNTSQKPIEADKLHTTNQNVKGKRKLMRANITISEINILQLTKIHTAYNDLLKQTELFKDIAHIEYLIEKLKRQMNGIQIIKRNKRGLINAVGTVNKYLFGNGRPKRQRRIRIQNQ